MVSRKSLLGNLQRVYLDIRLVKYFSSEALGEPIFSGHGTSSRGLYTGDNH